MNKQDFPYNQWLNDAFNHVVKRALQQVAKTGLTGEHHFYITFRTNDNTTDIPEHLRAKWPEEMTIALQHEFWDLRVDDKIFAVTLAFNGIHERLRIPLQNIVAFVDPSVNFAVQLNDDEFIDAEQQQKTEEKQIKSHEDPSKKVVSFTDFRKK